MDRRYLAPVDVEAVYGVDSKTLADWRYKGTGPDFSKVGRLVRYSVEDLDAFFKKYKLTMRDLNMN